MVYTVYRWLNEFQGESAGMAFSQASIAEAIERFIRAECQLADHDPPFFRDAHLFAGGFVDSLGFVQLIAFIESTFDVAVDREQLMSEDFTTINGISKVIASAFDQCVR